MHASIRSNHTQNHSNEIFLCPTKVHENFAVPECYSKTFSMVFQANNSYGKRGIKLDIERMNSILCTVMYNGTRNLASVCEKNHTHFIFPKQNSNEREKKLWLFLCMTGKRIGCAREKYRRRTHSNPNKK